MGEARASVPAVQRLLVACRGSVGQLHPDISREGRIGPILQVMDTMTAPDVGLVAPPECTASRAQATPGVPGAWESPTAGVPGRDASGTSSSSTPPAEASTSTSSPSSSSSPAPPFLSLSSWWAWWKGRPEALSPRASLSVATPAPASPPLQPSPYLWGRGAPGTRPAITYVHIYEDDYFSVGIFCLPKSASIPLHDHPGMSVLSKLLYGSLHVRAFDWAPTGSPRDHAQPDSFGGPFTPPRRLARQVIDDVMEADHRDSDGSLGPAASPSSLRVLHPSSGGNIHAFTALSDCAILDVLTPPYAPGPHGTGRSCTYYHATKASPAPLGSGQAGAGASQGDLYWLEPCQPPMDFKIQEGRYRGPKAVAALPAKGASSLASFPMWSFFRRGAVQPFQPSGQPGAWRLPLLGARV